MQLSSFLWSVADLLRGKFKPHEYGKVILPFTVLRRMDCVLEPTRAAVLAELAKHHTSGFHPDPFLRRAAKASFYNTSPMDLKAIAGDPANVAANLLSYIRAFSADVADIFERFELPAQIALTMATSRGAVMSVTSLSPGKAKCSRQDDGS